jgi:type I restriction enzyme S subunit
MTDKPAYLGWVDALPDGWEAKPLRSVARYRISSVNKIPVEGEMVVRLCNYTDVYNNEEIRSSFAFMESTATAEELAKFRLQVGDVLITKDSESWDDIAIPALVKESAADLICGYHLALLRPDCRRLTGGFLLRCLQADNVNRQFQVAASGVTRYGIPKAAIGGALIPVPPVAAQQSICTVLNRVLDNLVALIAKKQHLIELLGERRAALINRAVTQGLDPGVSMKDSGVPWLGQVPAH